MAIAALEAQDVDGDTISRRAAIALADTLKDDVPDDERIADAVMARNEGILEYQTKLSLLPSAQPERDIPKKVVKTINMTCGFPIKKAFCPWCNIHIRELSFFDGGPKISWCDICGRAIDWSDWRDEDDAD